MSLCAIIPVKPLRRGKSRLSSILSGLEREVLNRYLLQSLLESLNGIVNIDHKIVISYDPTALAFARKFGANTVLENRHTNINRALRRATMAAKAYGATKILILPADLPLISQMDIEEVLSFQKGNSQMIIAPDRKMNGTNALFINPIGAIKYDFGDWSFRKHVEQAERKGISVKIIRNDNISFDLDVPEDWELLNSIEKDEDKKIKNIFKEAVT